MRLRVLAVALVAVACSKPSQVVPEPPAVKATMPEVDGGEAVEPEATTSAPDAGAEAVAPEPEVVAPAAQPDAGVAIAGPDAGAAAKAQPAPAKPPAGGDKPAGGGTEKPAAPEAKKPPAAAPAQKAPAVIVLDKTGKQGVVTFNHETHQKLTKCVDCHHTTKEGAKVQPCRSCHGQADEGATLSWKNAAHKNCRDCHKAKGAPNTCNACHKK